MHPDEELLSLIKKARARDKEGERAFEKILKSVLTDVKKMSSKYYINSGDSDDVESEIYIGLWKAVMDFDENAGMAFKNFAINLCCKRHLLTCISTQNRKKFSLDNSAVSLNTPIITGEDDQEQTLMDFVPDSHPDILCVLIEQEGFEEITFIIKKRLTTLEKRIFEEYQNEDSYKGIADALGIKTKAVDNALMRVRKKAAIVLQDYEANKNREK